LVKDKRNTPFGDYEDRYEGKITTVDIIAKKALEKGVYIYNGPSWLIIAPPLIINKEEIDEGLSVLDEVISIADSEFKD
ncbi:MAG: aspartate aminotransferase family protein, partial [Saccharolobus sp.]